VLDVPLVILPPNVTDCELVQAGILAPASTTGGFIKLTVTLFDEFKQPLNGPELKSVSVIVPTDKSEGEGLYVVFTPGPANDPPLPPNQLAPKAFDTVPVKIIASDVAFLQTVVLPAASICGRWFTFTKVEVVYVLPHTSTEVRVNGIVESKVSVKDKK